MINASVYSFYYSKRTYVNVYHGKRVYGGACMTREDLIEAIEAYVVGRNLYDPSVKLDIQTTRMGKHEIISIRREVRNFSSIMIGYSFLIDFGKDEKNGKWFLTFNEKTFGIKYEKIDEFKEWLVIDKINPPGMRELVYYPESVEEVTKILMILDKYIRS